MGRRRFRGRYDRACLSPLSGGVEGRRNLAQLWGKVGERDRTVCIDVDGKAKIVQVYLGSHLPFLPIAEVQMPKPFADPSFETLLRIAKIPLSFLMLSVQG